MWPRSSPAERSTFRHGKGASVSLESATQARTTCHSASRSSSTGEVANAVTSVRPTTIERTHTIFVPRVTASLSALYEPPARRSSAVRRRQRGAPRLYRRTATMDSTAAISVRALSGGLTCGGPVSIRQWCVAILPLGVGDTYLRVGSWARNARPRGSACAQRPENTLYHWRFASWRRGARSSPSRALASASELLARSNDCGHGELDRVVTGMRADRLAHRASRFRRLRSQQRDPRHPSFRRLLEVCVGRRHPPNDWRRVPALVRRGPRSGGADGQRHKAAALLLRHSEAARRRLRKRGGDQVTVSLIGGEDWSVARPIGGPDPKDGSLCLTIGVIVRPWA
jgi:hypothetical protein